MKIKINDQNRPTVLIRQIESFFYENSTQENSNQKSEYFYSDLFLFYRETCKPKKIGPLVGQFPALRGTWYRLSIGLDSGGFVTFRKKKLLPAKSLKVLEDFI